MKTLRDFFEFLLTTEGDSNYKIQHVQNNLNNLLECDEYFDNLLGFIEQSI